MTGDLTYRYGEDTPLPPGETIKEILLERGIPQRDLATRMGKSEKFVSQLLNGKVSLTHATAMDLERVLGVPAPFWSTAEARYRVAQTRLQDRERTEKYAAWARSFPLEEMEANGWIARERTLQEQAESLLGFFGVSSIEAYKTHWGSERRLTARMSTAYPARAPAIAAWLRAGEREVERRKTAPFNAATFHQALTDLRAVTRLPLHEWQPLIESQYAKAGVAVVFVPDLPKTRCHAMSWWVTRSRAIIQLGLRQKTGDQLWFSLYHEAGHLLLDDPGRVGINDLDGSRTSEERADRIASDLLVPPDSYRSFIANGRPSKAAVEAYAEQIGIAPGIVVGRLQHDGIIPFKWMNDLKVRMEWRHAASNHWQPALPKHRKGNTDHKGNTVI